MEAILSGLDDEQRLAVTAPLGPVRILAGAGTGKTRSVTHRIAYLEATGQVPGHQVLAVTHSTKAASEMRERLAPLGVTGVSARTFHSAALRQLRHFWSATGLAGDGPRVVSDTYRRIREALSHVHRCSPGAVPSETVMTTAAEVSWARARRVSPSGYPAAAAAAGRRPDVEPETIAAAFAVYETNKRAQGVLDFDDLLSFNAHLLETRLDVAAVVRAGYTCFVVDEYQDTDPAQQRLLDAWLGDRDRVCVVGDPRQAIYGFKGGDPELLDSFARRFPAAVDVALVRDYRSTPQIVDAANALLPVRPGDPQLRGMRPDGPTVQAHSAATEDDEAQLVLTLVRDLLAAGTPLAEIAILHRYNSQNPALKGALTAAGISVAAGKDDAYFDLPEVQRPLRDFLAAVAHEPGSAAETLLREALDRAGWDERGAPDGQGAARTRWENQRELLAQVLVLKDAGLTQAGDVAAELRRRAESEHVPSATRGVSVMTIHKAKGLEWDAVILARATDGSLPAASASTPAQHNEERRLAYVALTRARHTVHVTWARKRFSDTKWTNSPSPYLALLDAAAPEHGGPPGRRSAGREHSPSRHDRRHSGASGRDAPAWTAGTRVVCDRLGMGTVVPPPLPGDVVRGSRAGAIWIRFGNREPVALDPVREGIEAL